MKRLATTAVLAAALVLGVALPAQAATFQGKRVMYYADHTDAGRYDWRVDQSVALWNRNPNVVLQEVVDCAGFVPCVTLVESLERQEAGVLGSFDLNTSVIEFYPRAIKAGQNPYRYPHRWFQELSCHELGHYLLHDVLGDEQHPEMGCLNLAGYNYRPGALLNLVPA